MGGNLQSAMRLQPMRLKNVQIIVGGQYIGRQFYFYFKVETIKSTVSKKLSYGGGGGHKKIHADFTVPSKKRDSGRTRGGKQEDE